MNLCDPAPEETSLETDPDYLDFIDARREQAENDLDRAYPNEFGDEA